MQKTEAAMILAGVTPEEQRQASAPTNLHVITGTIAGKSENGKTRVLIDGLVFSADNSQYIEIDTLGGLEEGDIATILLTGEAGHGMTPLAVGAAGSIDRIDVRIGKIEADYVKATVLEANYATITNLDAATARIHELEVDHVTIDDFEAEQAKITNLQTATADIDTIRANSAKVQNLTAAQLEADHATIGRLDSTYATITNLNAANGRIDNLQSSKANVTDLTAATGRITSLEAADVNITGRLNAAEAVIDDLDANYIHTDMLNADVAWLKNGVIDDGVIVNSMIHDVSANKLTAGTIDASNITVTNLNADNITTGTINGQRIGTGSLSLDKLEEDVYTETEVDNIVAGLQTQIDGAIETWTGTAVPTLQNAPAVNWNTNAKKDSHVGDVYFVVNSNSQQNGYNYRFTKSGNTYSWQLIKDSDVTNALARLSTAEGKITTFDSDISTLKTDTGTLKSKTTSLETRMSDAESDILDKVDTTTFNEVSDTVDGHTQSITQMSQTLSNKADGSTVTALTTRVSKTEQDISGINTTIGSLQTTVESKADGSTVETISSNLNTISDTVDGHTQSITSINNTLTTKADSSTVSSLQQDYANFKQTTQQFESTIGTTIDQKVQYGIDNLEIGGRNLVLKTSESKTSAESASGSAYVTVWNMSDYGYGIMNNTDDVWTISFDYEVSGNEASEAYIYAQVRGATISANVEVINVPVLENPSGRYSKRFKLTSAQASSTSTQVRMRLRYATDGATFTMSKLKLEKGNKATDWSPAPEDLESTVSSIESRVSTAETAIEQNSSEILLKANSSDVYTKQESDGLISTEVTNRNAAITESANAITLSVSQQYVTNQRFDDLKIGGRNLLLNTSNEWSEWITPATNADNKTVYWYISKNDELATWATVGQSCAFSMEVEFDGVTASSSGTFSFHPQECLKSVSGAANGSSSNVNWNWGPAGDEACRITTPPSDGIIKISNTKLIATDLTNRYALQFSIRCDYWGSGRYRIRRVKYELGSKVTDWTPAPEDMATNSEMASLTERVTSAETNIDENAEQIALNARKTESLMAFIPTRHSREDSYFWFSAPSSNVSISCLDDGWWHVEYTNTSSSTANLYMAPKNWGQVIPDEEYTFLVELRNYLNAPASGSFAYIQELAGAQFWGNAVVKANGNSPTTYVRYQDLVDGAFVKRFVKKADVDHLSDSAAYNGLCFRYRIYLAASTTSTFDIRVSVYPGDYAGPYNEYLTAASSAQLKVANDAISSKVSTTDYNGNTIASMINQDATTVQIAASKVEIDGTAIFNSISSSVDSAITSKGYATTGQIATAKNEAINAAATDASDKANAVQANLDNLEIGGRNLLPSSIFTSVGIAGSTKELGPVALATMHSNFYNNDKYIYNDFEPNTTYIFRVGALAVNPAAQDSSIRGPSFTFRYSDDTSNSIRFYYGEEDVVYQTLTSDPTKTLVRLTSSYSNAGTDWIFYDIKLEKGNKASDWTPAPEDTDAAISSVEDAIPTKVSDLTNDSNFQTDSQVETTITGKGYQTSAQVESAITTYVDSIEIGGRNLIRNGNFAYGKYYWVQDGSTTVIETDSARGTVFKVTPSSGNRRVYPSTTVNFTHEDGETYSLSFYAKADASNTLVVSRGGGSDVYGEFALTTSWQRFESTLTVTGTGSLTFSMSADSTFYLSDVMLVHGNKPMDYVPDPRDQEAAINSARAWYAECPTVAATAAKVATITPATTEFKLEKGVSVSVKFTYANNVASPTLNVNGTGAIAIMRYGTTAPSTSAATSWQANSINTLTYDGTYWRLNNWLNDNTTYNLGRNLHATSIKVLEAVAGGLLMVGTSSGYMKIAAGVAFTLGYPILYSSADYTANTTYTNTYETWNSVTYSNTAAIQSGAANKTIYLKGSISGNTFTIDSSNVFTTVEPTSEDEFLYIPLGVMSSATVGNFVTSSTLYAYIDGKFRQVTPTEIVSTHRVYYRTATANATLAAPSTWVAEATGNVYDAWTTKVPPMAASTEEGQTKYLYLYTCEQRKRLDGTIECTKVLLDENTTVIDGGQIITNSVTANQIAAGTITAEEIAGGTITSDQIAAGAISADRLEANALTLGNIDGLEDRLAEIDAGLSTLSNSTQWVNFQENVGTVFGEEGSANNVTVKADGVYFNTEGGEAARASAGIFYSNEVQANDSISAPIVKIGNWALIQSGTTFSIEYLG